MASRSSPVAATSMAMTPSSRAPPPEAGPGPFSLAGCTAPTKALEPSELASSPMSTRCASFHVCGARMVGEPSAAVPIILRRGMSFR